MDGEFSHPKMCIRNEVRRLAAIGPQENNSISGFSGANDVVRFLGDHQLFSPQFEKRERQPDRQGFQMIRRFARKVDLSRNFCKSLLFLIVEKFTILAKIDKIIGTRQWHLVSFQLSDDNLFDVSNANAYLSPDDFLYEMDPQKFKMTELESFIDSSFDPAHDPYDLYSTNFLYLLD